MGNLEVNYSTVQARQNSYTQLTSYFDAQKQISWCYMHPEPRSCFTPTLLGELVVWLSGTSGMIEGSAQHNVKYFVLASKDVDTFNLGGDLDLFKRHILARDRDELLQYAVSCISCIYAFHSHLNHTSATSIALVQGLALGGGFESALAANILIAERGTVMGLPEILFNLFPGMGALTFLGRRVGHQKAEKIISSGELYLAEELYEMGVVDVLAEQGEGEKAVYDYIQREEKSRNGILALRKARDICQPVTFEELFRITCVWVDAALRLEAKDLRMMERLVNRQTKKYLAQPSGPG